MRRDAKGYCVGTQRAIASGRKRLLRRDAKGYCVGTQRSIASGRKGLLRRDAKGYCVGTQRAIASGRKGLLRRDAKGYCVGTQRVKDQAHLVPPKVLFLLKKNTFFERKSRNGCSELKSIKNIAFPENFPYFSKKIFFGGSRCY